MIGVFDSGLGGLVTLQYLTKQFPQYTYTYLGDVAYVPRGERSPEWIQERTFAGLHWLFARGCTLVILACNTASAYAIRQRQEQFPDQKVLSITIPGVEKTIALGRKKALLLGTRATITSCIYESVFAKQHYDIALTPVIGTGLVDLIETGAPEAKIREQLNTLLPARAAMASYDGCILGCTHYPLLIPSLKSLYPTLALIDPAQEAVDRLGDYLAHHATLEKHLARGASPIVYLTALGQSQKAITHRGLPKGEPILVSFG